MECKDTNWNLYDKILLVCNPRRDKPYYEAYHFSRKTPCFSYGDIRQKYF